MSEIPLKTRFPEGHYGKRDSIKFRIAQNWEKIHQIDLHVKSVNLSKSIYSFKIGVFFVQLTSGTCVTNPPL